MTGRTLSASAISSIDQSSRMLLLVVALCLVTMPQSYKGGAERSHPHAIFQFWVAGGHHAARHHHGDDRDIDHHRAGDMPAAQSTSAGGSAARADTPTISQMATSAGSGDAIGGDFGIWLVLIFGAATVIFFVRGLGAGSAPSPERPPPRLVAARC
jgi:hypothetical protein